jgi:hypothetical protein
LALGQKDLDHVVLTLTANCSSQTRMAAPAVFPESAIKWIEKLSIQT